MGKIYKIGGVGGKPFANSITADNYMRKYGVVGNKVPSEDGRILIEVEESNLTANMTNRHYDPKAPKMAHLPHMKEYYDKKEVVEQGIINEDEDYQDYLRHEARMAEAASVSEPVVVEPIVNEPTPRKSAPSKVEKRKAAAKKATAKRKAARKAEAKKHNIRKAADKKVAMREAAAEKKAADKAAEKEAKLEEKRLKEEEKALAKEAKQEEKMQAKLLKLEKERQKEEEKKLAEEAKAALKAEELNKKEVDRLEDYFLKTAKAPTVMEALKTKMLDKMPDNKAVHEEFDSMEDVRKSVLGESSNPLDVLRVSMRRRMDFSAERKAESVKKDRLNALIFDRKQKEAEKKVLGDEVRTVFKTQEIAKKGAEKEQKEAEKAAEKERKEEEKRRKEAEKAAEKKRKEDEKKRKEEEKKAKPLTDEEWNKMKPSRMHDAMSSLADGMKKFFSTFLEDAAELSTGAANAVKKDFSSKLGVIATVVKGAVEVGNKVADNTLREVTGGASTGYSRSKYAGLLDKLDLGQQYGHQVIQGATNVTSGVLQNPDMLGSVLERMAIANALGKGKNLNLTSISKSLLSGDTNSFLESMAEYRDSNKDNERVFHAVASVGGVEQMAWSKASELSSTGSFRDKRTLEVLESRIELEEATTEALGGNLVVAADKASEALKGFTDVSESVTADMVAQVSAIKEGAVDPANKDGKKSEMGKIFDASVNTINYMAGGKLILTTDEIKANSLEKYKRLDTGRNMLTGEFTIPEYDRVKYMETSHKELTDRLKREGRSPTDTELERINTLQYELGTLKQAIDSRDRIAKDAAIRFDINVEGHTINESGGFTKLYQAGKPKIVNSKGVGIYAL